jgi:hypothetical protein
MISRTLSAKSKNLIFIYLRTLLPNFPSHIPYLCFPSNNILTDVLYNNRLRQSQIYIFSLKAILPTFLVVTASWNSNCIDSNLSSFVSI